MGRTRFGVFEFDPETGELFRDGRATRLQAQPAKVLAALLAAKGELVTRETLRETVWSDGTTVDFERGLNFAIAQVRTALGDSAATPVFIRTVPKRGYRFIAPLPGTAADPEDAAPTPAEASRGPRRRILMWGAGVAALLGAAAWGLRPRESRVAVARFQNETGDPAFDRFADTVTDSVVAGLTASTAGRHAIIGNAAMLRRPRNFQDLDDIADQLGAGHVILGQVQRDGRDVRVLAHLITLPGKAHVKVSRVKVDDLVSESRAAERIVADLAPRLD